MALERQGHALGRPRPLGNGVRARLQSEQHIEVEVCASAAAPYAQLNTTHHWIEVG